MKLMKIKYCKVKMFSKINSTNCISSIVWKIKKWKKKFFTFFTKECIKLKIKIHVILVFMSLIKNRLMIYNNMYIISGDILMDKSSRDTMYVPPVCDDEII